MFRPGSHILPARCVVKTERFRVRTIFSIIRSVWPQFGAALYRETPEKQMKTNLIPMLIVGICAFSLTACTSTGTAEMPANTQTNSTAERSQQTTTTNAAAMSEAESNRPDILAMLNDDPQPAPENSEYAAVGGDKPMEVRVFKSHPTLAKVEKIAREDGSIVKVHYTDGRIVQLPGSMIDSLSTISSAEILRLAAPGPRREKKKTVS